MQIDTLPNTVDELFVWLEPILISKEKPQSEFNTLKSQVESIKFGMDDFGRNMTIVCIGDEVADAFITVLPKKVSGCRIFVVSVPPLVETNYTEMKEG